MKFIPIPVLLIVVFVATQQVNSQQEKPPAPERSQVVYPNLLSIAMGLNLGTPRVSLQPDTLYTSYDLNSKLVKLLPDGFENKINSFYLPEGYMAVFAENNDGSGESSCFVALDGAIAANLPARLRNKISFVRYLRVNNPNKRGSAQGADKISSSWYYNWGSRALSFERQQYVPMIWGKTTATDENVRILTDRKDTDHLLSFNEPDHKEQANIPVDVAVARYKIMLKTGLRIGSPVTTQDNFSRTSWRAQFMNGADAAKLRVDYITLHWYDWGNETITGATDSLTAVGVFNRFVSHIKKARATYPGKPIWVTEYNANRKRTSANVHRIFMKLSTAWMNESAQNYIERYVYFFPPELPALNSDKSPTLLGEYWKNISSPNSFSGNIINDATIFKFKLATPTVTWPNPSEIVYGTSLDKKQLNATASVGGTFFYTPPAGTKLNAGDNQQLSVIFMPADIDHYTATTKQVTIQVAKATPTITWANPADIVYGTALSASQLNAESSVGGSFVYTPTIGSELDAGVGQQLFVAFTPNDTQNYLAKTAQVTINITQAPQTIMFTALADKTYGDIPFELSGTSSSGLPLVYVSSDPTVALVDGSRVTIVGAGTTVINASQPGDANYQPVAAQQILTVNKANQTISFAPVPTVLVNSPAFALTAAASSSLLIAFSTTSNNITLTNGSVGIIGAGRATITATQPGSPNYNAAEPVSQSFCINPAKPSIAISNLNTPSPLLTSSAPEGNQWYLDGVAIAGATGATYMATKSGSYQVRVTIDGCTGEFADEQPVVITGVETTLPLVEVYPNPVTGDLLFISFGGMRGKKLVTVFSLTGKALVASSSESGSVSIDVGHLSAGTYFVKVIIEGCVKTIRFQKLDSR